MRIELIEDAITDFDFWKRSGNKAIQRRIQLLLADMLKNPFNGIGKPEILKYKLSGKWFRRINEEHRIIYEVIDEVIFIYSLKGHYNK
ncbi:Txe/YoeB family addiction module toxin [Pedobacter rhizosphaerae]|uniref:Putative mRNA interferase YoeB n=1 Tax=Pedobacter rhizosphaerae TaxID=390241 RepID=A0A1H9W5R3_9SPHI|nr:Txe/YoeB family addiction module toxin [Pedobacter rhizosphaerae]SES29124.1 toxin YoeB [Pedobacter rhizosphaerae]